jgi:hypothetical protein
MRRTSLVATLAVLLVSPSAVAADTFEACKTMTAKLAMQAKLSYWDDLKGEWGVIKDPMKSADLVVRGAYLMTKPELDKKWPGFYDWSALMFIKAWSRGMSPRDFQTSALVDCVSSFD